MDWYLYILECKDRSLYMGITNNIEKRLEKHNDGSASRYTAKNRPVKLIYSEQYSNKNSALKREVQLKGWIRKKKLKLINNEL